MEALIYLDTNVVLWLAGDRSQLSKAAARRIAAADEIRISPMVELELEYLFELRRLRHRAPEVLERLGVELPLRRCDRPFAQVVARALGESWTRDPFDRVITAQAALGHDPLLTRDKVIRAHYARALW